MPNDPFSGVKNGNIDLGVGNPSFMFDYWKLVRQFTKGGGRTDIAINEYMSYDYDQANEELRNTIKKLHKKVGNANADKLFIVFGHGASQLISAAGYAAQQVKCGESFYLPNPHWPRIRQLLKFGGAAAGRSHGFFIYDNLNKKDIPTIDFITSPNNPDGSIGKASSNSLFTIYDLCYNWPQYTSVKKYDDADIQIYGLGKATGHAGTRFGWALVKDKAVADYMKTYIELSTSGVSQDAQIRTLTILKTVEQLTEEAFISIFDTAKQELDSRWVTFKSAAEKCKDFKVLNNSGMFAWCEWSELGVNAADKFSDKYHVHTINGEAFGAERHNFRVNLASNRRDFDALITSLNSRKDA